MTIFGSPFAVRPFAHAAFDAGGGGRAAQAERMLAAAKQAAAAPTEEAAPTGVIGLDAAGTAVRPGTHTWNSDAPAAAKTAARPAAAAQAPAPGAALPPAAAAARPSAARAGVAGGTAASMRSSGACAASFTSSALTPVTRNEAAAPAPTERKATRKAYVALHTSHGDLNLELHADLVPRACHNFLLLAARGYYDGVTFHRSIKHFMSALPGACLRSAAAALQLTRCCACCVCVVCSPRRRPHRHRQRRAVCVGAAVCG